METREQLRLQQPDNRCWIVHRSAVSSVLLPVKLLGVGEEARKDRADLVPHSAEAFDPISRDMSLVGAIQWHHHDLSARTQPSRSRLWIHVAVELRRRGDIAALRQSTAHP